MTFTQALMSVTKDSGGEILNMLPHITASSWHTCGSATLIADTLGAGAPSTTPMPPVSSALSFAALGSIIICGPKRSRGLPTDSIYVRSELAIAATTIGQTALPSYTRKERGGFEKAEVVVIQIEFIDNFRDSTPHCTLPSPGGKAGCHCPCHPPRPPRPKYESPESPAAGRTHAL